MKIWITCLLMVFMCSCASKSVRTAPPSDLQYPHGIYQHKVDIKVAQPPRHFDMKGIVDFKPERLNVVGLSAFGTTVFRISEDFKTGQIKKEFYLEVIQQNSARFEDLYFLIRELLLTPKNTTHFEKRGAKFTLSKPDRSQIFRHAKIEHPQFTLNIEVTSYEF